MFKAILIVSVAIVLLPLISGILIPAWSPSPQIVGGHNASAGQFPWQISLRYNGSHNCGGSILNKRWIITAAHCVNGYPIPSLKVHCGCLYLKTGGTAFPVERVIVHPDWDPINIKNDLALVEIQGEIIPMASVEYIPLENEEIGIEDCTASGWGRLYRGGPLPNQLQFINLKTLLFDDCRDRWAKQGALVGKCEICTLTFQGQGVCNGDSGGPLVCNGKLVGIVSWGSACANGIPDVYTRISCYISWIKETMLLN